MFRFFRHKKKEMMPTELPTCNYSDSAYETSTQSVNHIDSKMARLMELIGCAIKEWAVEYHLENLPKRIVFEQALDAMRAIEFAMHSKGH